MPASVPPEQTAPLIQALKAVLGAPRDKDESDQSKTRARAEELIAELETCLGAVDGGTARPQAIPLQDISTVLPGEVPQQNSPGARRAAQPVARLPQPAIGEMPTFIPADPLGKPEQDRDRQPPSAESAVFGPYDLLEKIGRGGMGVVYKARQRTLNRIVALKRVRFLDSISPQELKRFQLEAEAAGRLNHPHIVPVYEFSEQSGEQFFTMAYIDGVSLAVMTAQGPMPPRDAAGLMKTVAEAIAFAHENGVIHRDLKPANILLDANGEPHITDFGLAKKIDEDSSLTATGQVMGTPSYMAPEQAEGKTQDVGPLSDVYSLGAVLYCTLVGRPPFQAANVVETLKQVIDQEPVPPRQLNRSIDRDMETICLKCLAKESHRRYLSARALADDLGRFLNGEPVHARPVGRLARAWRWSRRNRMLAGLSAAAVVALLLGSIVSTAFAIAERRRAAEARASAAEATENFDMAREAVDQLYTRVSEEVLLHRPGMQEVRDGLLGEALRYYQRFLAQRGDDTRVREELATAHFRVGLINEKIKSPDEALPSFQEAERLQRGLLADRPDDIGRIHALADSMNAIGRVQHHRMQPDAAYPAFDEAASLRHRLVDLAPGNREFVRLLANSLMNLGMIELSLNRMEEARELSEQAQTIRRQLARQLDTDPKLQRDLASGHFTVGRLLYQLGDRDEQREQPELARQQYEAAREQFEHAIGWFEKLRRSNSDDHENDYRFANCYRMLGDTDRKLNRLDDAVGWYRQASQIVDSLVAQNPAVPDYRADQAAVLHNLGELHRVRSDPREALESFQRAVAIQRLLVETHGSNVLYRLDWAKSLRSIAAAQKAKGRPQDAAESLRMSAEQLRELAARFPEDRQFADELEITERDMATNGANGPRQEN